MRLPSTNMLPSLSLLPPKSSCSNSGRCRSTAAESSVSWFSPWKKSGMLRFSKRQRNMFKELCQRNVCSADKCLIANSFSCFKPRRESSCSVCSLTRVKSNCSNDDRPETSMDGCCMNITDCVIAWLLEACSKPLQNYAEYFFDQRCSELPAFEEVRRQMDQAVVRQ